MANAEKYQGCQGYQSYKRYLISEEQDQLEEFEVFDGYKQSEDKMSEKGEEVYISEAEVTEPTKELEEDEEAAAAAAAAAAASAEAAAAEVDEYFEGITELENQLGDDPPKKDGNPPEKSEYSALLDSIFGELPPKSIIKVNLRFPKPAYPNRRAKTHRGPPKCLEQNEESC